MQFCWSANSQKQVIIFIISGFDHKWEGEQHKNGIFHVKQYLEV